MVAVGVALDARADGLSPAGVFGEDGVARGAAAEIGPGVDRDAAIADGHGPDLFATGWTLHGRETTPRRSRCRAGEGLYLAI